MNKHISVAALLCRTTIFKILALLLVMAAVQGLLFYFAMDTEGAVAEAGIGGLSTGIALENIVTRSHIQWVTAAGFLALCIILCYSGCEFGAKSGYTWRRLSISEQAVFLWQSAYNTLCLILLWAVQAITVFALCAWFTLRTDPAYFTGQTVFLAFYRDELLHSLLPLGDVSLWIRNALMAAGMGIAAAAFPFRQREGKFGGEAAALVMVTLVWFTRPLGGIAADIFMILAFAFVAAEAIHHVFFRYKETFL